MIVTTTSLAYTCWYCMRHVWSSNPGPAKSDSVLQTARHRFNIYASSRWRCDV